MEGSNDFIPLSWVGKVRLDGIYGPVQEVGKSWKHFFWLVGSCVMITRVTIHGFAERSQADMWGGGALIEQYH